MRSIICTSLLLAAAPVLAQDPMPTGCFTRAYDSAHLQTNPNQRVADLVVRLYDDGPDQAAIGSAILRARLANTKATRAEGTEDRWVDGYVACYHIEDGTTWPDWFDANRVTCFAECDGGSFQIVRATEEELLIRSSWLSLASGNGACGEPVDLGDEGVELTTFRLDRASESACDP